MEIKTVNNQRTSSCTPIPTNLFVKIGEKIDIQKLLSKLPFTTTGIPQELHLINHQFTGPGTDLFYENESRPGRLYEDPTKDNYLLPKEWSIPINPLDEAAYRHDLKYYFAGDDLELKHKADNEMIKELENYTPESLIDKFYKWVVIKILSMKVKFGLGVGPIGPAEVDSPLNELTAKLVAKELYHPYRTGLRRKVIVNGIDDTHACDLIEMPSEVGPGHLKFSYVFTNIDIFSKYGWCIALPNKKKETLINALKYISGTNGPNSRTRSFTPNTRKPKKSME